MNPQDELLELTQILKEQVRARQTARLPHRIKRAPVEPEQKIPVVSSVLPGKREEKPLDTLEQLNAHLQTCQLCTLGASRQKVVFGVGNPRAKVMVIGEGPGYMEDRKGEPFVGPAGQLLDKILASIGLSRQQQEPAWKWVYIANMVKCHPMVDPSDPEKRGNDRAPSEAEMEKCFPFLKQQIEWIQPALILALGATAAKALLKTSRGISLIRGQWFDFKVDDNASAIQLLPTYHPAALLRNPDLKKETWEDMKKLRDALQNLVP